MHQLTIAGKTCPYGVPGDRLWVRETFRKFEKGAVVYRASLPGGLDCHYKPWTPSIFMPRWASRITLEVVSVRVERVQEISVEDAKAEGVDKFSVQFPIEFKALWDSINAKRGWDVNPFVWVIEFKRMEESK